MSGEPPNGFESHRSDNGANIITAREFSDEIRDWLGVEGILDMRAYVRFRFLDYFKTQLLPGDGLRHSKSAVSEEEMAINSLVIDFTLKHKYYFTTCLLISEIQAFSRFDERLKQLLTLISKMSTDDMENLTPLLDREHVSRVLRTFNIDPLSEIGMNIHQAYQRNEKHQSLIQLVLSHNNGSNSYAFKKGVEADNCFGNDMMDKGNGFSAMIESFTNQITHVNRKVKQMEFKFSQSGLGMRHRRRTKATEDEVKRLKGKFADISRAVEKMRSSVQVLLQLVNHIRMQGQRTLERCSPYISHILALTNHIGRIEVAVRRIKRKLTAQNNKSRARAIKRRRLKIRQMANENRKCTGNSAAKVSDKNVQTEVCGGKEQLPSDSDKTKLGVAVQTNPLTTVDAHTQSDSKHPYANNGIKPSLKSSNGIASREKYNEDLLIPEQSKIEEDDDTKKREDNSVQTVMSSFQGQDTPTVMEQNYELHGKVLEQSRRINYLTIRIAQLHAGLAEKEMTEQEHHTYQTCPRISRTDACTNTDDCKITQTGSVTYNIDSNVELNVQRRVPSFDSAPLRKALRTAKVEIAALKRERRNIQERSIKSLN